MMMMGEWMGEILQCDFSSLLIVGMMGWEGEGNKEFVTALLHLIDYLFFQFQTIFYLDLSLMICNVTNIFFLFL